MILTIIPVVFPSSLITKFLKTGLFKISLKPLILSTPSSFSVTKLFNLSFNGLSELFNNGTSRIVITLWTQLKLCNLNFKLSRLFMDLLFVVSLLWIAFT